MADINLSLSDPVIWMIFVATAAMVGLGKSGIIGPLGFAMTPILALALPPKIAAGVLLPTLIVVDLFAVWAYRRQFAKSILIALLPGSVVGVLLGWVFFATIADHWVSFALGIITCFFCLYYWLGNNTESHTPACEQTQLIKTRISIASVFWGSLMGFASFVAHAGSPPFAIYALPKKLSPVTFVATIAVIIFIVNLMKLPLYAQLGQLNVSNLALSAILLPMALIFLLLGIKIMHAIPYKLFYQLIYPMLFLLGLKLISDGFAL